MTDYATKLRAFAVYNGLDPADGPRAVTATIPVDATGQAVVDLTPQNSQIGFVQAVYCNNPTAKKLTVTHRQTGFTFTVNAQTQGWYAVLASDNLVFDVVSSVPNTSVSLTFTNVDMGMSVSSIA